MKDDKTKTLIKGAPEIILKNCDLYYDETGTKLDGVSGVTISVDSYIRATSSAIEQAK